jgi:hypothetical protein
MSTETLKNNIFLGSEVRLVHGADNIATLPPSMSRLSRQCGILKISQPYRHPRPVTAIALLFLLLCRSSGHWSPGFHHGGPLSVPGQSMWDLFGRSDTEEVFPLVSRRLTNALSCHLLSEARAVGSLAT